MDTFKLVSEYQPTGDQPEAIAELVDGLLSGDRAQTLMGVILYQLSLHLFNSNYSKHLHVPR